MPTPTIVPYIPDQITVHLGAPDQEAQNVTVSFQDYIQNVASSEIYPTWNISAIRANVLAQISYALNRVYLEYYRSRGYPFDITNSTTIDQSFVNGRNIFENIEVLVNEIFNNYIRRIGFIEPLAAKYCNGTTSTCAGMSQWGSQQLAENGANSIEILKNYYGNDIELVTDAPLGSNTESYPGTPLRLGSQGQYVTIIQVELNRISQNYPLIPKINPVNGVFDEGTEESVKIFQDIFNLPVDGIVGSATWYKLILIYTGVKNLSELNSEGQRLDGVSLEFVSDLSEDSSGEKVMILQYFLNVLSEFYLTIPSVVRDGVFGPATKNSVIQAQNQFNLAQTGVVNNATWEQLYNAYKGILDTTFVESEVFAIDVRPYGGVVLKLGSEGDDVVFLKVYLNEISNIYPTINELEITGFFGSPTQQAVEAYQAAAGLPVTGEVDNIVWNSIINSYKNVISQDTTRPLQFPGITLKMGDSDINQQSGV